MTDDQFKLLAVLLKLRGGPTSHAVGLVLVDGLATVDAAALVGIAQSGVSRQVVRCRAFYADCLRLASLAEQRDPPDRVGANS